MLAQAGDDFRVRRPLAQVGVVEKLVEGGESRVGVGQPQHQQLLQRQFAVWDAFGGAGQVIGGDDAAAVNRQRRELLDEVGEGLVEPIRLELSRDCGHRAGHGFRVDGPAVDLHGVVEDLVDQPHGVEFGRVNDSIGIALGVASVVHLSGEAPRGGEVRDDDVAARFEQRLVELVAFAGRPRDVELECHGCAPRMRVAWTGEASLWTCESESSRRRPHGRGGKPRLTRRQAQRQAGDRPASERACE